MTSAAAAPDERVVIQGRPNGGDPHSPKRAETFVISQSQPAPPVIGRRRTSSLSLMATTTDILRPSQQAVFANRYL